MKTINISAQTTDQGPVIDVDKHKYLLSYSKKIWKAFPLELRNIFAETAAFFSTRHLNFITDANLQYNFAPNLLHSLFSHGLFYTIPEFILEFPEKKANIGELLTNLFKSSQKISFTKLPTYINQIKPLSTSKSKAIMPFSFGKDSLLTFGLLNELGIEPIPIFFVEPSSINEKNNKEKLRKEFEKKYHTQIIFFPVETGKLRQSKDLLWGWDLLLTQYTLLTLPFIYYFKPKYFFWSHEQNHNIPIPVNKNLEIVFNCEESNQWRYELNNMMRFFNLDTHIGSLIEPIYEILDTYILHRRYSQLASFQLCCDNDHDGAKTSRWCGHCSDCAYHYTCLLSLGINPKNVGLTTNMLTKDKEKHFYIFKESTLEGQSHDYGQYRDETLLAFYLIYKRNIRSPLVKLFTDLYLQEVEKRKKEIMKKFTTMSSILTVPTELKTKLLQIYKQELKNFYHDLKPFL